MIITLSGDNKYELKRRLTQLIAEHKSSNQDLTIENFDCAESNFEQIYDSLNNTSLFGTEKLIILRDILKLKELTENIDEIISKSIDIILIIIYTEVDKRSKLYKTLKAKTNFEYFSELDSSSLAQWIVGSVKDNGGSISTSSAKYLVDVAGSDQVKLLNEIKKLIEFNNSINKESIDLLCEPSPQSTVFQLLDATFSGNPRVANKLYEEQRAQNNEPLAILGLVSWQLHIFALVKSSKMKNSSEIAKRAGLSPFVVSKAIQISNNLTWNSLKNMIKRVALLEHTLKTESVNPDQAIKNLLLQISMAK